jgi:UPF0716 protein FxsA
MPPMALVFLLMFVALPLLEIALLIKVASLIGIWLTFAIIVGTAILGFTVAQRQGLGVARRMLASLASGEPPVEHMLEGMLLMFAGACLIAPGLITDAIGAVLLVPPLRRLTARTILGHHLIEQLRPSRSRAEKPWRSPRPHPKDGAGPTIETDYERLDDKPGDRK